ncbi:hypothetical protein ACIQGZ_16140 [Streptomyces sp. NPDC092296]|uniref:hypothetical protein n=1 Tax=Streptomyces sp. NPDC092296 TaxID=3366012 RepID=UPI00381837DB
MQGAIQKLTEGRALTTRLTVDADADQIIAFDQETDSGETIERADAKKLAGLKISVAVSADKPLKDVETLKSLGSTADLEALQADKGIDFAVSLNGGDGRKALELRQVAGTAYAQVDLDVVGDLVGDSATFEQLHEMSGQLPPELAVLKAALDGKWVSIDNKAVRKLTDTVKEQGGADILPSAEPSLNAATGNKLLSAISGVFSRNVTFDDKGQQDGADLIVVSAPARTMADDLLKALRPVAKDIPGLAGKLPSSAPSDTPDRTLSADLRIKDGALASITVDLAQFEEKQGSAHLPITLSFDRSADAVQAPEGAVPVTPEAIDAIVSMAAEGDEE